MKEKPVYENINKRLDSMKAARQFIARAIVKYDHGEISAEKLNTLSKAVNTLLRALEHANIESRISELEQILEQGAA